MIGKTTLTNDEKMRFHKTNANGEVTGIFDFAIADYVLKTNNILQLQDKTYIYNNGVYQYDPYHKQIAAKVSECMYDSMITARRINEVIKLILLDTSIDTQIAQLNNYPELYINFKNGMYDPIRNEMHEHNPQYNSVNQINCNYNPMKEFNSSTKYTLDNLLGYLIPDKQDIDTVFEFFGYAMTTSFKFQRYLTFLGDGRTGKSEILGLLISVLGDRNCSNASLETLSTNRFAPAELFLKTANICGDISKKPLEDTTVIKLLTGGDSISAELKGRDPFRMKSYAKPIFSTNDFPNVRNENTNAFFERMLIIKTCRRDERVDIPNITDKLSAEKDYFIYRCIQGLQRLIAQGGFTISESCKKAVNSIRSDSDSIFSFMENKITINIESRNYIKKTDLYREYCEYCEKELEQPPKSKKEVYKVFDNKVGQATKYCGDYSYKGILIDSEFIEITNTELEKLERVI